MSLKLIISIFLCFAGIAYADPIRLEVLQGEAIKEHSQEFASLCHVIYGEYPYLYDGKDAGYEEYINSYADSKNSIVCMAFDGKKVIGAAAGMPLAESRDYYQAPFNALGIDVKPFFYLSELIVLKEYRGKGIGTSLYNLTEDLVKKEGCFPKITCCAMENANPLWIKLGFQKHPEIAYDSFWTNIGDQDESPHHLVFWVKELQKVVVISGASGGIGLATVKAFQAKGWKVWAGYHRAIPEEMPGVKLVRLDVADDRSVQAGIETVLKEDGRIDALINNAGYGLIGAEECLTIEEAKQQFEVNFFGPLRLIQAVLPSMRQQQSGHIINISSGVGVNALPGLGLYSASKFALEGMSESLAATLAHWDIKVSVVEPGFVKNHWGAHCLVGSRVCPEDHYQKLTKGILNMLATPQGQPCEEVAELLVHIAETHQPDFRYQTTPGMKAYIAEKLVDPSGNGMRDRNISFLARIEKIAD